MQFLAAAGCVAVFASIPFGWGALGAVVVTALGVDALLALVVPDLPSFRASVDAEINSTSRVERQNRLLSELSQRGETRALETFEHMRSRVLALYQTAGDASTTLTKGDVDKLADLTVDYLNLCLVNVSLKERRAQVSDEDVRKRVAALQSQLKTPSLAADEERQIQKAMAEYVEAGNRSRRLEVRRSALEATLLSLPDKLEEVYQLVMAAPFSSEMGNKIEESLSRLRIAEEVSAEFDSSELFNLGPLETTAPASTVTPLNAARRAARSAKN
jgi:ATP-dependent Lon protease